MELKKIKRIIDLKLQNKRKVYWALMPSVLTYPLVPIVSISTAQYKKLQRIQDQSLRWMIRTYTRTKDGGLESHFVSIVKVILV